MDTEEAPQAAEIISKNGITSELSDTHGKVPTASHMYVEGYEEAPQAAAEIISRKNDITSDTHGKKVPPASYMFVEGYEAPQGAEIISRSGIIIESSDTHGKVPAASHMYVEGYEEAPQAAAEIISRKNDITSDTHGKKVPPASYMFVEGYEAPQGAEIISRNDITSESSDKHGKVLAASHMYVEGYEEAPQAAAEIISRKNDITSDTHGKKVPPASYMFVEGYEAPQGAEIISRNDITSESSDTHGKVPAASHMYVEGYEEAPQAAAEIISRKNDITSDTNGEEVPPASSMFVEGYEAPQGAEIISRNDITSDTHGKVHPAEIISRNDITSDRHGKLHPALCWCVEGYKRHRLQGVAGGLFVALVGLCGLVVGLSWYWFGPSDATCTGGSVVECRRVVVDGMSIFPSAWQAVIAIFAAIASSRLLLVVVNRRLASTSGASIAELEIGAQGLNALSYQFLSNVDRQTELLPLAGIVLVHVAMHAAQVYSSSGMVAKSVFVGATADVGNSYGTMAERRTAVAPMFLSYYLSTAVSVSQCFTCVNVGYDSLTYIRNVSMAAPPLNGYQSALGVEVAVSTLSTSGADARLFSCPENTRVFIDSSGLGDGTVDLRFNGSTCGATFWWQVKVVARELAVAISVPSVIQTTEGVPAGQLAVLGSQPTGRGIGDIELQNLVTSMQQFNVTSVDPSLTAIIGQGLSDGTSLNSLVVSWVAASLSVVPAPKPARVWTAIKSNVPVMTPGACIAMSSVGLLLVLSAALELYLRVGCPHNIHSLTLGQVCAATGTDGHYGGNDGGAHCRALETSRWRLGAQSGQHLSVEQGKQTQRSSMLGD